MRYYTPLSNLYTKNAGQTNALSIPNNPVQKVVD